MPKPKHPAPKTLPLETTLPSAWYLDADIFKLEKQHIFFREWVCVGREEELESTGDYQVLDVYGESIILLRNTQGALRAFYNVCRHRGSRLCEASQAHGDDPGPELKGGVINRKIIRCPYHAWTYDLDGQLIRAPHLGEAEGFPLKDVQLYPVGVVTWGGFIFVNLSPENAPDFSSEISVVDEYLKRYPLKDLRIGHTIEYEIDANWKVLSENYNECYHCGPVHPELCRVVPAFRERGGSDLDWERGIPHREGATTFTRSGETTRRSFPGLNEDELVRHKGYLVYPNLWLSLSRDHVAVFILKARSAGHTSLTCHFLFEQHEMDQPGFDPSDAVDFWHIVNRQDWKICSMVQQGMAARVHEHGYFSPMEDWNLDIRRYVKDRIGQYVTEPQASD